MRPKPLAKAGKPPFGCRFLSCLVKQARPIHPAPDTQHRLILLENAGLARHRATKIRGTLLAVKRRLQNDETRMTRAERMRKSEGAKTSDREVSGFEFRSLFGIWHSDLARGHRPGD